MKSPTDLTNVTTSPQEGETPLLEEVTRGPNGKKIGRPRRKDIESKKPGKRGVPGRPPGEAAIINEFKARILQSPKSAKVIEAIFDAALDNDHKNQGAAWKLLMDRMLPVSMFEKDKLAGKSSINITISGVGETILEASSDSSDIIEGELNED